MTPRKRLRLVAYNHAVDVFNDFIHPTLSALQKLVGEKIFKKDGTLTARAEKTICTHVTVVQRVGQRATVKVQASRYAFILVVSASAYTSEMNESAEVSFSFGSIVDGVVQPLPLMIPFKKYITAAELQEKLNELSALAARVDTLRNSIPSIFQ